MLCPRHFRIRGTCARTAGSFPRVLDKSLGKGLRNANARDHNALVQSRGTHEVQIPILAHREFAVVVETPVP
jgi:hypothetical protein